MFILALVLTTALAEDTENALVQRDPGFMIIGYDQEPAKVFLVLKALHGAEAAVQSCESKPAYMFRGTYRFVPGTGPDAITFSKWDGATVPESESDCIKHVLRAIVFPPSEIPYNLSFVFG